MRSPAWTARAMQSRLRLPHALLLAALAIFATTVALVAQGPTQLGAPLGGLTPREFELFRLGLEDFLEVEEPEEGLGPSFNGGSCAACHNSPAVGGVSL